jgi:hypothetical protein
MLQMVPLPGAAANGLDRTDFGGTAEVDECPGVVAGAPEDVAGLEVPVSDASSVKDAQAIHKVA